MARRHLSDNMRTTVTALVALVPAFVGGAFLPDAGREIAPGVSLVGFYLVFWPSFTAIYLASTHVAYSRRGGASLEAAADAEAATRRRWWNRVLGSNDSSSLTLLGAVVAIGLTIAISRLPEYRSEEALVALGLLAVASSWAQMVYAYALDYLRLDTRLRREGRGHIEFHLEPGVEQQFGDYLTFAVLASTMAATISADVPSRRVWQMVRTNVVVAFGFNSVVVAMVVSLLFGGLTG
jgi:uncharacterized membrane protein